MRGLTAGHSSTSGTRPREVTGQSLELATSLVDEPWYSETLSRKLKSMW